MAGGDDETRDVAATDAVPVADENENNTPDGETPEADGDAGEAGEAGDEEELENLLEWQWVINDYASLPADKIYSEPFKGKTAYAWRCLIFPHGNGGDSLSLYLDATTGRTMEKGWNIYAHFSISVIDQDDDRRSVHRDAYHRFNEKEADWGFTNFMKMNALRDPTRGYLKDDKIIIEVAVELNDEDDDDSYFNYDSRKATGHVGIRNQGATCYMNSLLQTLYATPYFTNAVYQLPTEDDEPTKSVALALQRVFYNLQFSPNAVGTKELTKSFGWDAMDSFTQHDIQELNRVLQDNLEQKMKGTTSEGTVQRLFQGRMMNYIECVNVDYASTREEAFYDISLNVKGLKGVYEAFDAYTRPELLEGDNQYRAEGHGLQDARKGVKFLEFPPVLHLQLKRFEYDFMRDQNVKINDRFEFAEVLELDPYLADDADRSTPCTYDLHGVLVHSGDVHGGHYYAFIRPDERMVFFKFDDDRVTKASNKAVLADNFGMNEDEYLQQRGVRTRYGQTWRMRSVRSAKRYSSAYMLVYVRRADKDWVMRHVSESDIPDHLHERFMKEQEEEEERIRNQREAHLYLKLYIAKAEDFAEHSGSDLVTWSNIEEIKIKKSETLNHVKEKVSEMWGIAPERQRYWCCVGRQNKTIRPETPVRAEKYDRPLSSIFKISSQAKLFLEVSDVEEPTEEVPAFVPIAKDEITLYFKLYDATAERLQYVGKYPCKKTWTLAEVRPVVCQMAGLPEDQELICMEEIRPTMIEPVEEGITLKAAELTRGDILTFQIPLSDEEAAAAKFPTIDSFYAYLLHRVSVTFRRLNEPKEDACVLELSRRMTYDEVCAKLGAATELDGEKLRLTAHNSYTKVPKPFPIHRTNRITNAQITLNEMLFNYYNRGRANILYFEELEMTLTDLLSKVKLEVNLYNSKVELVSTHTMLVPKRSTCGELIEAFRELEGVELAEGGSGVLRLLEVSNHRISKVFGAQDSVNMINEHAHIRIEEIPAEDLDKGAGDRYLNVASFHRDTFHLHSEPFVILLKHNEPFSDVKPRIQARLEMEDEDFEKINFALVAFGRPRYLKDETVLSNHDFWHSDYLGMDHEDKTPPSQRRDNHRGGRSHHAERAIKIYNQAAPCAFAGRPKAVAATSPRPRP